MQTTTSTGSIRSSALTYKITPDISVYGSYSEANRAPTPLELGCSSPSQPCMIDNFLVADPPLKQIVARTVEAGFKGQQCNRLGCGARTARLERQLLSGP